MSIITDALKFAYNAHGSIDQRRKYTGDPYIVHPIAVADIVKQFGGTEAQIAAALLHDVVEDTPVTLNIIELEFGEEIAKLVEGLTDVSKPEDGNRAARKAIDRAHTLSQPAEVLFVKCADLIHNTKSITEHDKGFAVTYMKEKELLLDGMDAIKDTSIWIEAMSHVEQWKNR